MKSAFSAGSPPTRTSEPIACAPSRARDRVWRARPARRWRRSERRRRALSRRGASRCSRVRPHRGRRRSPASPTTTCVRVAWAVDQHLVREQRAGADPRALERVSPSWRRPAWRSSRRRRSPSWSWVAANDERDDDRQRGAGGEPAPAHDGLGPAGPRAARLIVGAAVRPVQALADLRQHDRQQRDRDERRDERDQHPSVAHRAQERERQRDQREEADRDRGPAEHDRAPRGLHRALDGLVAAVAVGALLAPPRDDEQRVVDRDAEPDQRDQELHDRRHVGERGQAPEEQERGHDRDDRHQDRDDRQERREHEREHDQRAEPAEQRLEQHAGAVAAAGLALEGVEARQVHRARRRPCVPFSAARRASRHPGCRRTADSGPGGG